MPALYFIAFVIRLAFVGDQGFKTDVGTFEAWTISLVDHGLANFYSSTGFADYPPGYFYILALVGHIWQFIRPHDTGFAWLQLLVKLPAILADIGIGALLFALARRFKASAPLAIGVASLYLFNPATIYISANWGQVDSIAGGFALLAVWLLLKSDDLAEGAFPYFIPAAWIAFAYSLLIKPQAAVLIPLFIAFAFVDPARRRSRLIGTACGILAAFLLAIVLTEPFHPSDPLTAMSWLLEKYRYGSSVYDYNSVNAFNLWAIHGPQGPGEFWDKDSQPIAFLPQYYWGIGLVVAALVLIVWRYVTERTNAALLEACALATLAFFVLATRMHERYSFDALMFVIACVPLARRYLWGAIALTVVLFANLQYSLEYLNVVTQNTPNMNPKNLWGWWTSGFAVISVGTFFGLGYAFLGAVLEEPEPETKAPVKGESKPAGPGGVPLWRRARSYFDPSEGLARLRAPIDYVIMGSLGIVNFVLSFVNYWLPKQTSQCWTMVNVTHCGVFDEIYFARAAEEYLRNMRIYENTHPPLSKLLVTLSVMMFGGLQHGDTAWGWRFLDVVFGALVIMLLYAFAKRVTGSTLFATITAAFLTLDGMHFVQSRIGTPEGFVVFFATLATYAFYRFWIASQVEERRQQAVPMWGFAAGAGVSLASGLLVAALYKLVWNPLSTPAFVVVTLYVAVGAYLAVRYVGLPRFFATGRRERTFADGSYTLDAERERTLFTPDGGSIASNGKTKTLAGEISINRGGSLVYAEDDVTITYRPDMTITYATPVASATYADNTISSGNETERGGSAKLWLIVFTLALGLLISTKWYGVMGFPVSFIVLIFVWLQRVFRAGRPALWGNPRGFRLDGAMATILFIAATVYGLVWIPDLVRQSPDPNEIHNFNDVVDRQYSMFMYHDTLVATHPYASKWWEWPLDYVPIAYHYADRRKDQSDPKSCCVEEITSMPNPFIMWFGLASVPIVGFLAWRNRNKAYALIVLTYLLQWLPWMRSPRITFAYHFYVDIPLICLCNAIVLQHVWEWGNKDKRNLLVARSAVFGTVAIIAASFIFFYPILSAQPISWDAWHARMWIDKWIVGPG
jgi:Gpi18-like mannosyltransferase/predicted membrane-bound dolichyl-phosphate-mannose-protein mannosyltransferase